MDSGIRSRNVEYADEKMASVLVLLSVFGTFIALLETIYNRFIHVLLSPSLIGLQLCQMLFSGR